jgi:hypothetical protein
MINLGLPVSGTYYLKTSDISEVGTALKISSFAKLGAGWHYGGGVTPDIKTIGLAKRLLTVVQSYGVPTTDAFPGTAGEIMVTGYTSDDYLELICAADGTVAIVRERNGIEDFDQTGMNENDAVKKLGELLGDACNTLGYYTLNTSTRTGMNSKASRSRTMMGALLSSNENVWMQPPQPSVITLADTTPALEVTPQFSGYSTRPVSLRLVG